MIQRSILEWERLPYGPDAADRSTIPEGVADRIAAVAASSPLAGHGGNGVLEHGRHALRARSVVGVIAAEGCALEILPKIDVQGEEETQDATIRRALVHMLAVALDMRIDVGVITDLDWQRETLLEILIRVFTQKLTDAVRQGMPRRYVRHEDDLRTLRGALDSTRQFTRHAVNPSRLACRFDELSCRHRAQPHHEGRRHPPSAYRPKHDQPASLARTRVQICGHIRCSGPGATVGPGSP